MKKGLFDFCSNTLCWKGEELIQQESICLGRYPSHLLSYYLQTTGWTKFIFQV